MGPLGADGTERETMKDPAEEFFDKLNRRGHEPLLQKANGTIRFDMVDGKGKSSWFVAIKKGDVTVSRAKGRADCTFTADKALFEGIMSGEVNAMAALLRGELGIEGDLALLALFQRLFPGPAASAQSREVTLAGRRT
jgi:putative sterol carrier protein